MTSDECTHNSPAPDFINQFQYYKNKELQTKFLMEIVLFVVWTWSCKQLFLFLININYKIINLKFKGNGLENKQPFLFKC